MGSICVSRCRSDVPHSIIGLADALQSKRSNAGLVLQLACQEQNVDPLVRNKTIDILARHIDDALMYQREHGARKKNIYIFAVVRVGKFYGAYVSTVYVFIKSLHLCNVILQFLLLNSFLETAEYPLFGAHVLYDLLLVSEGNF
ncbi:hypothetical protein COOONC_12488 [Cooperia oncophora]